MRTEIKRSADGTVETRAIMFRTERLRSAALAAGMSHKSAPFDYCNKRCAVEHIASANAVTTA